MYPGFLVSLDEPNPNIEPSTKIADITTNMLRYPIDLEILNVIMNILLMFEPTNPAISQLISFWNMKCNFCNVSIQFARNVNFLCSSIHY